MSHMVMRYVDSEEYEPVLFRAGSESSKRITRAGRNVPGPLLSDSKPTVMPEAYTISRLSCHRLGTTLVRAVTPNTPGLDTARDCS